MPDIYSKSAAEVSWFEDFMINEKAYKPKKKDETNESADMMVCPKCGAENELGAKTCSECGAKLPRMIGKSCPKCDTINSLSTKACHNCGNNFHKGGKKGGGGASGATLRTALQSSEGPGTSPGAEKGAGPVRKALIGAAKSTGSNDVSDPKYVMKYVAKVKLSPDGRTGTIALPQALRGQQTKETHAGMIKEIIRGAGYRPTTVTSGLGRTDWSFEVGG